MHRIQTGRAAPNPELELAYLDGQTAPMATFWEDRAVLIIFLRHLA